MSGAGGGLTIYNVLLFYTIFMFFVGYIAALAGTTILTVGGNPFNIPIPSNVLDIVGMFNFFVALLSTNTTYQLLSIVIVAPFLIMLTYALMQLVRGTG